MDLRGNWNYPTSVRFGAGRINELGEAVKAAGMRNPLFVTDPVVAKMPIPGIGWQAYGKDTEGNLFGIHQFDPSAR